MRKTKAGKILLGITNLVFLVIMFTAVYSAIPPAYNVTLSPATLTSTPSAQIVSVSYTVTNNGFYDIGNFYLSLSAHDQSNNFVNETHSIPVSIQRGYSQTGTLNLDISQSYISSHHGNYNIVFTIHSEFAFGLIKFSVESPNVVPL
jgi:hypothetical protein